MFLKEGRISGRNESERRKGNVSARVSDKASFMALY